MLFVFSAQKSRPYYIIMKKFVEKSIIKHFSPWIAKFFEKIFEKRVDNGIKQWYIIDRV